MNKNTKTAVYAGVFVAFMVGVSFASVPLYDMFCRVTGFGGTPMLAESAPGARHDSPTLRISFNADVNPNLPWDFKPKDRRIEARAGEPFLIFYEATNTGRQPVVGTATFNVTPLKAGKYFSKIECFCFTEQLLKAGETMDFPVSFFIDPAIADDPAMRGVQEITLSYTFFKSYNQQQAALK